MTNFNTGNPIGSTDARDLSDNAQNFDNAVNATGDTWTDRLGVARRTLRSAVGYTGTGTDGAIQSYTSGLVLSGYNVIILYSGEFYRPSASATLPYTTTATLPDVDSNLVSIGDANLRQDLADNASGSGAALVSMEGGPSVEEAVLDRVIRVTSIAAIEAYSAPVGYVFSLNAGGRSGNFDVIAGDFSTEIAADTFNSIYIALSDDPTSETKVAKRRYSGAPAVQWWGADDSGAIDITAELQDLLSKFSSATLSNGIFRVSELDVEGKRIVGLGRSATTIIGDGDLLINAGNGTEISSLTIKNDITRGKLVVAKIESAVARALFYNISFEKSISHIYGNDGQDLVHWLCDSCVFNDASDWSRKFSGLWAYEERHCYTWFNLYGFFVTRGANISLAGGVFEFNQSLAIHVQTASSGNVELYGLDLSNAYFESNGNVTPGPDILLENNSSIGRIKNINLTGSTFWLSTESPTVKLLGRGGHIYPIQTGGNKDLTINPVFNSDVTSSNSNVSDDLYQTDNGKFRLQGSFGGSGTVQLSGRVVPQGKSQLITITTISSGNGTSFATQQFLVSRKSNGDHLTSTIFDDSSGVGCDVTVSGSSYGVSNKGSMSTTFQPFIVIETV